MREKSRIEVLNLPSIRLGSLLSMYISEKTLDDLLLRVVNRLLASKRRIDATRGSTTELTGVMLKIRNPRARLSRTEERGLLFSGLGELLWYLAGSNKLRFIRYYLSRYVEESEDGKTIHGAYGPRLFNTRGNDQVRNVLHLLRTKATSRRAVIQLFDASDLAEPHIDVPCTCSIQLFLRDRRLHMLTSMRSNDVFKGLPHDVFAFTMFQEIIARSLSVELGEYKHAVGSLHLYEEDREKAHHFVEEGWQSTVPMPPMPFGDPWPSIRRVLKAESAIRRGVFDGRDLELGDYWGDIVRLLEIFQHSKNGDGKQIAALKRKMSSDVYGPYIEKKKQRVSQRKVGQLTPTQRKFPFKT
jgi:thymidylate synthase